MTFYITSTVYRKYVITSEFETVNVYIPPSGSAVQLYTLTFNDYAGYLRSDSIVKVYATAGGTAKYLVSSDMVSPAVRSTAFYLTYGYPYIIAIKTADVEYEIVTITADDVTSKTIYIYPQNIPEWMKVSYKYIRADAYRDLNDASVIVVDYQDLTNKTSKVVVTLTFINNTKVYESTYTSSSYLTVRITNCSINDSYIVNIYVEHQDFGTFNIKRNIPQVGKALSIPNIFTLPFTTGNKFFDNILLIAIILVVAGSFGSAHAHIGLILTLLMCGLFTYLGWLDIQYSALSVLLTIAILYAFVRVRRW
jgi:hypothetical protein